MSAHSSKFVWHDLMTSDVDGAKRFYGELLGWKFDKGKGGGPYEHIVAGDQMIGGMMKLDEKQKGTPPHWLGYVGVEDVDKAVASVQSSGGKVYAPKMTMPDVGAFAVVGDAQGAAFAPFRDAGKHPLSPETDAPHANYTFCWDELLTNDPAAAAKFYGKVFGWGAETMEIPGMPGGYTLLKRTGIKDAKGADKNAGGIMQSPPGAKHPPFWLLYVAVPDADATAERVKRLGGQVMMPPMDIPNVGRFFPAMDPQNAAIAFLAAKP
jgi:predicted enzyme related to lactoylglutathione lyase